MSSKSKIITFFLFFAIIVIMGSIFYITKTLTSPSDKKASTSTPTQKTKASSKTYNKLIAINQTDPSVVTSTSPSQSPTPTEIILAYQNPSPTIVALTSTPSPTRLVSPSVTQFPVSPTSFFTDDATVAPTNTASGSSQATSLPETGIFQASLLLLTLASGFIVLAFLF